MTVVCIQLSTTVLSVTSGYLLLPDPPSESGSTDLPSGSLFLFPFRERPEGSHQTEATSCSHYFSLGLNQPRY
jgi:hypothetical protein